MHIFKRIAQIGDIFAQLDRLNETLAFERSNTVQFNATLIDSTVQLDKRVQDLSLQVEEIYDIVQDGATNADALRAATKREQSLLSVVMDMTAMLDDFAAFAVSAPQLSQQATAIVAQTDALLSRSGLQRIGAVGEALNAKLHIVAETADAGQPFESVIKVLRSGFAYDGKVLRKAYVVVNS